MLIVRVGGAVDALDTDGDGEISKEEMEAFIYANAKDIQASGAESDISAVILTRTLTLTLTL